MEIFDSYGLPNLMKNILKIVEGDIRKRDYKNKHNTFQKRAKDLLIFVTEEMNIFRQTKDMYKKETNLNLKTLITELQLIN